MGNVQRLAACFIQWSLTPALLALGMLTAGSAPAVESTHPASSSSSASRAEGLAHEQKWSDAAKTWAEVTTANPTNGHYWRSLAFARRHLSDLAGAAAAEERAIALGEAPAEAAYAIATSYARAGQTEAALSALERAFALGFRDLERVRSDEALSAVRKDARFLALAGLPAAPLGAREEGWRFDLQLLAREVHRRGYSPFRMLSASEFDARVQDLESRVSRLSDAQTVVEVAKLLRSVGDGHTSLLGIRRPEFAWALPLQFALFEEGLYVTAADPRWRALLGARVVAIGGHRTDEVLALVNPIISRDNESWPRAMAPYRIRSTALLETLGVVADAQRATLSLVEMGGRAREVTVDADQSHPDIWNALPFPDGWVGVLEGVPRPLPLSARNNDKAFWLEYQPGPKLLYVQYNRVADEPGEPLRSFASRLSAEFASHDVQKLVIDLRLNNGGDTFLNEALLHCLLQVKGLDARGRLFVLIGRRTFSAGMNAAVYLERHLHPVFVGEPTGGKPNSAGDEVPFFLPYSQVLVNVSDLYWQASWPDDRRNWIAPELYIPPTFAALRSGRDPAMEAVLAFE